MGLDQYLFKISKMPEQYVEEFKNPINYTRYNELLELNELKLIDAKDSDEVQRIDKKYITACNCENEFFDIPKAIKEILNIDIQYKISGRSYDHDCTCFELTDINTHEIYHLKIPNDDSRYIYTQSIPYYAMYCEEAAYWRKAYIIRDLFVKYANYNPNDNIVYYPLNKEMCDNIINELSLLLFAERHNETNFYDVRYTLITLEDLLKQINFDNELLCYYEWY